MPPTPTPSRPGRQRVLSQRALAALGEPLEETETRALYVAACRELFEEAGLLLAHGVDERSFRRLCELRPALQAGTEQLRMALAREGCVLALARLTPFARWITPEFQKRRWDTRFFVAEAPEGQTAECDGTETSEAVWLAPAAALDAYGAGEHLLAPPTFRVLEDLCGFFDRHRSLRRARLRRPSPTHPPHAAARCSHSDDGVSG